MSAPKNPPPGLLEAISNLTRFHRQHEQFYSQAPLGQAREIQAASRALKALADHWSRAEPSGRPIANPFAGAEDLNAPGLVSATGILFMEGEGEPAEIVQLRRDLATIASDCRQTGEWLSAAMEQAWGMAAALVAFPAIADLLGERHRIIANDWQAAAMSSLTARLIERALELLERVDFTPEALRNDMGGSRESPPYLYSASELLDRGADLLATSSTLVHENERRWRVFGERVAALRNE